MNNDRSGKSRLKIPIRNTTSITLGLIVALAFGWPTQAKALHILLTFDSSVTNLPDAVEYEAATEYAAAQIESLFSNPITITIDVSTDGDGYGGGYNQTFQYGPNGALDVGDYTNGFTYSQVRHALISNATGPFATIADAHLPLADPTNGGNFIMPSAQLKALGLQASITGVPLGTPDGYFVFNTSSYTLDPNNRAVPGEFDFIGVAEHEMTHIMGRLFGLGGSATSGYIYPYDLFRYSSPGVPQLSLPNPASDYSYFSINGGVTNLKTFGGPDAADWDPYYGPDSFNSEEFPGEENALSADDIAVMNVLGYTLTPLGRSESKDLTTEPLPSSAPEPPTLFATEGADSVYQGTASGALLFATVDANSNPAGLALDGSGNLYVGENSKSNIVKITTTGSTSLFATLPNLGHGDALVFDRNGNLYVADGANAQIDLIDPTGSVSLFASLPSVAGILGLAIDSIGDLYTADFNTGKVYKIDTDGSVHFFAQFAATSELTSLACDADNNVYVADINTNRIYRITPAGRVSLFATLPQNSSPWGMAFDTIGNLYVAGFGISKISPDGRSVTTFETDIQQAFGIAIQPVPQPASTLVAGEGDNVGNHPGGAILEAAGSPAIDAAGDVAFHATVTNKNTHEVGDGILLYTGTTFRVVAQTGTNATNSAGVHFHELAGPALSGSGELAFIGISLIGNGVTAANDTGVYLESATSTNLIAEPEITGATTPGGLGATYKLLNNIGVNDAGGVAILPTLSMAPDTPAFFASDQSSDLHLILKKGDPLYSGAGSPLTTGITAFSPLPGVAGQSRTLDAQSGNVALLAKGAHGAESIKLAIASATGFTLYTPAETGDPIQLGAKIKSLEEPAVNSTECAFLFGLAGTGINAGNDAVIGIAGTAGISELIVQTGNLAPDDIGQSTAAVFSGLGNPVLSATGSVAFVGTLQESRSAGVTARNSSRIFICGSNGVFEIVSTGDDAPGGPGEFAAFQQIALMDSGDVIFQATLSGVPASRNSGVWASTPAGIIPILVTGQQLDFHGTAKTVKSIQIFEQAGGGIGQSRSFDASTGKLVYQATFDDGTWGIYQVALPD
jgi:sugar lactone lactonase YvrE